MQCQFKIGDLVILAEPSAKFAHDLPGMLVRIQPIKYHLAAGSDDPSEAWARKVASAGAEPANIAWAKL